MLWLLLIPLAYGAIQPLQIDVYAVAEGPILKVQQTYYFSSDLEQNLGRIASEIGFRYSLWKYEIEMLDTFLCEAKRVSLSIVREIAPSIVVNYTCNAREIRNEILWKTFLFDSFKLPLSGGLIVLPGKMSIKIEVPKGYIESVSPEPQEMGENYIVWRGPLQSGEPFRLVYRYPQLYTVPSISKYMLSFQMEWIALFLVLLALYFFRERIKNLIVKIISHLSQLE